MAKTADAGAGTKPAAQPAAKAADARAGKHPVRRRALLVLLAAASLLCLVLGSCGGDKYERYYAEGASAYQAGEYAAAAASLEKAVAAKSEAEAYLLLSRAQRQLGQPDQAIQTLYIGYSKTGDAGIAAELEELKGKRSGDPVPESVTVAGESIELSATTLVLADKGLTDQDAQALSHLTALENLSLSGNRLSSAAPLSGLTRLLFLQLSDNSIEDLTPLRSLSRLKTLYLDGNPVKDLTPLYALTQLKTLSMKGIDFSQEQLDELREALPACSIYADRPAEVTQELALGGLTFRSDVRALDLSGRGLSDISDLSLCTRLEELNLARCGIGSIAPLVELSQLRVLDLTDNAVDDLRPLMTLTNLGILRAGGNRFRDVTVLSYLTGLAELDLSENGVAGFAPLARLTRLQRLSLRQTGLIDDDLAFFTGMQELTQLDLRENPRLTQNCVNDLRQALPPGCEVLADEGLLWSIKLGENRFTSDAELIQASSAGLETLGSFEHFTSLRVLILSGNSLSSVESLRALSSLESLDLSGNRVSDLTPLAQLASLRSLDLTGNPVAGLAPLAQCRRLQHLYLGGCGVEDLSALRSCSALTQLDLSDNNIRDLSPLYDLRELEKLDLNGNPALSREQILALQHYLPDCAISCGYDLQAEA